MGDVIAEAQEAKYDYRWEEAVELYALAFSQDPHNEDVIYGYVDILDSTGRRKAALEVLDQLDDSDLSDRLRLLRLACLYAPADGPRLRMELHALSATYSHHPSVLVAEAILARRDAGLEAGLTAIANAQREHPTDWTILSIFEQMYAESKRRIDEGLQQLESTYQRHPEDGGVLLFLANLHITRRNYHRAQELIAKLPHLPSPGHLELRCRFFLSTKKYPQALEAAAEMRRRYPERPESWAYESKALYRLKKAREAEQVADEGLTRFPQYGALVECKFAVLFQQWRLREALMFFRDQVRRKRAGGNFSGVTRRMPM